jgi:hypothetical protein
MSLAKFHDQIRMRREGSWRTLADAVIIKIPSFDLTHLKNPNEILDLVHSTSAHTSTRLPFPNIVFHFDKGPRIFFDNDAEIYDKGLGVWVRENEGPAMHDPKETALGLIIDLVSYNPELRGLFKIAPFSVCLTFDSGRSPELHWKGTYVIRHKEDSSPQDSHQFIFEKPNEYFETIGDPKNFRGYFDAKTGKEIVSERDIDFDDAYSAMIDCFVTMEYTVRHALQWFGCRNIVTTPVVLDKKIQKARRKKKKPEFSAYTLTIDPSKTPNAKKYDQMDPNWSNRFHLARGHVRTYGEDGKGLLFGKYKCKVWIPPHTRGSQDEGVISKDYEIVTA